MKNTFCLSTLIVAVFLGLFFFPTTTVWAKQEMHSFTLYPGIRKGYTLLYPLKATRPGRIRINVKLKRPPRQLQIWAFLIDKKRNKVVATYISKKERDTLRLLYNVDSMDLRNGGLYELGITNYGKRAMPGEVILSYPVKGEPDAVAHPNPPDLAIDSITLDRTCHVEVRVSNHGPGPLLGIFWKKNGPTLMLSRNGRSWGGAGLKIIDPDYALRHAGGKAIYHSRLKVGGQETIRAEITPANRLKEVDMNNNVLTATLSCRN